MMKFVQMFLKKYSLVCTLIVISFSLKGQHNMRTTDELINNQEPGWNLVRQWIDSAANPVEVLPADSMQAFQMLYNIQVTTRSPMGAIVYSSGGLLIDGGWIRVLGSGCEVLNRSLPEWNRGKAFEEYGQAPGFLLIADDAVGGFFLLNGGGLGSDLGQVYYFAPESLLMEPLGVNYSEFLQFCFSGDLNNFYKGFRWEGWQQDLKHLTTDEVFGFYPFLWTKEGADISKCERKPIPVAEQYLNMIEFRKQLGLDK